MTGILRATARAALAWVFVRAGWDVLQRPESAIKTAGPLLASVRSAAAGSLPDPPGLSGRRALPALPELPDDETLVRTNAAVQVAGGLALAAGIAPRLAAAALIGSLIPTSYAGHPFWTLDDPAQRTQQRNHFNKNLGLAGGLLLVILTGGRPPRRQ